MRNAGASAPISADLARMYPRPPAGHQSRSPASPASRRHAAGQRYIGAIREYHLRLGVRDNLRRAALGSPAFSVTTMRPANNAPKPRQPAANHGASTAPPAPACHRHPPAPTATSRRSAAPPPPVLQSSPATRPLHRRTPPAAPRTPAPPAESSPPANKSHPATAPPKWVGCHQPSVHPKSE